MFTRAADGALTLLACAEDDTGLGCPERDGLSGANGVALPPSGPGVYVASESAGGDGDDADSDGDGALAAFHAQFNGVSTTLVQDACIPAVPSPVSGNACENPPTLTTALRGCDRRGRLAGWGDGLRGRERGIVGFARDPSSGELATRVACIKRIEGLSGCGDDARMGVTRDLALDAAGESLYVAASDRLVVFDRQPLSGGLTLVQCMKAGGGNGCVDVPGVSGWISGAAVSPDGRTVYVTSALNNLVLSLRRDPATGLLTALSCVSFAADPGCSPAAGLAPPLRSRPLPAGAPTSPPTRGRARAGPARSPRSAPRRRRSARTRRSPSSPAQPPPCRSSCSDTRRRPADAVDRGARRARARSAAIDQAPRSVAYTAPATAGPQSVSFSASDGVNSSGCGDGRDHSDRRGRSPAPGRRRRAALADRQDRRARQAVEAEALLRDLDRRGEPRRAVARAPAGRRPHRRRALPAAELQGHAAQRSSRRRRQSAARRAGSSGRRGRRAGR